MPRAAPHSVKSAIRLERQSTTVPNTSNTRAFTFDTSDIIALPALSSFRDGSQDQTRNLEIPRCAIVHLRFDASHRSGMTSLCSKYLSILNETKILGDLIEENAGLRIGGVGQPVHPVGAGRFRASVDRLDQRPSDAEAARAVVDEQILQIAVIA